MTVVVAPVEPPHPGLVLTDLVDDTVLTRADAANLYEALVKDLCRAATESGGDLLLNYRPAAQLPGEFEDDAAVRAAVESLASDVLTEDELAEARFEVQVGSTPSARVGNTVAHLLDEADVESVTVADPAVPLRSRQHVDSIAMKLRRSPVVLAPAPGGRTATAAFKEPIDFEDALTPPTLVTLTDRARDADLDVDFAPQQTLLGTESDLVGVLAEIHSRQAAGRWVPPHTTQALADLGLGLDGTDDVHVTRP